MATINNGLPTIAPSDTADVPRDFNALAEAVDTVIGDMSTLPTTAKDAAGAITELHAAIEDIDVDLPDNSVTDAKIGNRSIDDTIVAATGADTPTRLWSKLANMIKRITGKANWYDAPATTLEAAATHAARTDNPHTVTKAQVGLSNVENFGTATQAEAEAGTVANKFMTPQRSKQYVDKRLLNDVSFRMNAGVLEFYTGGVWEAVGNKIDKSRCVPFDLMSAYTPALNAWVTILNITGKGFLDLAVTSFTGTTKLTLKITVDGVVTYLGSRTSANLVTGLVSKSNVAKLLSTNNLAVPVPGNGVQHQSVSPGGLRSYPYTLDEQVTDVGIMCVVPDSVYFYSSLKIEIVAAANGGSIPYMYSGGRVV